MRLGKTKWISLAAIGLALPMMLPVQAQPDDARPRRDRPEARRDDQRQPERPGFGRMQTLRQGPVGMDALARMMAVLTPEQRSSVREVFAENREKVMEREQKMMKARKQLLETSLEGKFNEQAVRKQARVITELEAERMVMMAKTLASVEPPLTPEQKEQVREAATPRPPMDRFRQREGPEAPERERSPERKRDRDRRQPE